MTWGSNESYEENVSKDLNKVRRMIEENHRLTEQLRSQNEYIADLNQRILILQTQLKI